MKKNYFSGWNFVINFLIAFIPASMVAAILRELAKGILINHYQNLLSEGGGPPEELAAKLALQGGLLNAVITIVVIFGFIYLVGLLRKKISERGNKKNGKEK